MPEPLTIALTAFTVIKKGIAMGKDLQAMGKDVNTLFAFIDGAKEAQKSGNKNDPLSSYIAYEKAKEYEAELTRIIQETRGASGLRKFQEFRKQAQKNQREGRYKAMQRKNKIMEIIGIFLGLIITLGGLAGMIWFAMEFKP